MATPRYKLVDDQEVCDYHLVSRCVRRARLCGRDPATGRDFSHRRRWLADRFAALARCFAVDVHAWAVMDNHFHLVVRHDPKASSRWSDAETAHRWVRAFPPRRRGDGEAEAEARRAEARARLLADPQRLARARRTLGSLSAYMKHVKQPVARRANLEDGCTGHFFEQRFHSGALLGEAALLAAMAYVDLNPVRAGLVRNLAECRRSSIGQRVRANSAAALAAYLRPLASGLAADAPAADGPADGGEAADGAPAAGTPAAAGGTAAGDGTDGAAATADAPAGGGPCARMTLSAYAAMLEAVIAAETPPGSALWRRRAESMRRPQRAHGPPGRLRRWAAARGFQCREKPLPE